MHKGTSRLTCGTILMALFVGLVWYLFSGAISNARNSEPAKLFDPYVILNVTSNSTLDEIKQSYRKLAMMYHPDKNPDIEAPAKFNLITKAYHSLTDPTARRNYELYGNPDGKSAMSIGIGLPKFLALKENRVSILLIFFLILLVVLPIFALSMLGKYSKKNGLNLENCDIGWFLHSMKDQLSEHQLVDILSVMKYWTTLNLKFDDEQNTEMNSVVYLLAFQNYQSIQTTN
jgi:translocation protein SEC63